MTLSGPSGAVPWPANASVAHLKVNGTATVASLAAKRSTVVKITRFFRSRRSAGQMYGHKWTSVRSMEPLSAVTSRLSTCAGRWKSLISARAWTGRAGRLHMCFPSYRVFCRALHPQAALCKTLAARTNRRHIVLLVRSDSMSKINALCVYCGSSAGTDPAFGETARSFGKILAVNDIRLVYGGGSTGLMGALAE